MFYPKVLKYADRVIKLKPYNTKTERDLLIYTSDTSEEIKINDVIDILSDNIESSIPLSKLSRTEIFNIILQLKNISVGESFNFICTCNKCNRKYDFDGYFIDTLKDYKNIPNFKDIKITEAFSDDYSKYVDIDIDELDVMEYDSLVEHIEKHRNKFNFSNITVCPYCNNKGEVELDEKTLVSNLSEDTISNFYEVISGLVYFGNYSLSDINEMLPFERSIYLGMLNKQKSKQAQSQN